MFAQTLLIELKTMMKDNIIKNILMDDSNILKLNSNSFLMPDYDPLNYYKNISSSSYFYALSILRHYIKLISDYYFCFKLRAKNIDLFMLTSSISSPIGPGSDSEPIKIKFGKLETFLVDSSQFGFEPLLLNNLNKGTSEKHRFCHSREGGNPLFKPKYFLQNTCFDSFSECPKVYCYLPSMRGEDPDNRHLNQFFHCEAEIVGTLNDLIPIIEDYIRFLCKTVFLMNNIIDRISNNSKMTKKVLKKTIGLRIFPKITFDEAVNLLIKNGKKKYVNFTNHGKDITSKGEIELTKILKLDVPIWIKYFDRDRTPFYQKPCPENKDKTINADLLFPPLTKGAFGGEIAGSGQRQDDSEEMYESLKRQNNISPKPYEWYIDLRRFPNYKITSGFGLGIERFIAWALAKDNIRDVIPYPRLKNVKSLP